MRRTESLSVLSGDKDFDHPTGNVTNVYGTANAEALSLIKVNELRKFRAIWYMKGSGFEEATTTLILDGLAHQSLRYLSLQKHCHL